MKPGLRYMLRTALLFLALYLYNPLHAQKKSKIKFQADNIEYDEKLGKKARRLIDNVVFEHKGAIMYCDSAWHYPEKNSLDAFGKVHIKQGDSLNLYCDFLYYDGEKEIFNCRQNVVLDNKDIRLTTDYLVYNQSTNYGFYLNGGVIVNRKDSSTLKSQRGYYYTQSDDFYFKQDVTYKHPDFFMEGDSLLYNSGKKKTIFLGPTYIHASGNLIYCERGYFNSVTGKSLYYKNAYLISESRNISGDSIYYNSLTKIGTIIGHANILDTAENISVRGNKAWIYEKKDSAIVTDHTELQQYFEKDTLFLHADTFKVFKNHVDSSRFLKAYWHVRFFKSDMQGKCDSMVYSFSDSAIKMFYDPVLWSGENQITGTYIQLNTANGKMNSMDINKDAFVASYVDPIKYNQIRGKDMRGYFKNNNLDQIYVTGNGQTIYYAQDDDKKFIGVNRGESSDLRIKLKNNEINDIYYIKDGTATFFPLGELAPQELKLRGFKWLAHIRPKNRQDIFLWVE